MNNINQDKISIVIPVFNFPKTLPKVLHAINNQTHRPVEIVIICSGDHQNLKNFLKNNEFKIPININFVSKAFPGEARNIGAKLVKSPWVAFLDSKTIPNKNWLEAYLTFSFKKNMDIILGCTRFISKNSFQSLYKYCSYGNINYETVPGTLIKTKLVIKEIPFSNHYRYGEDRLWKKTIGTSTLKFYSPTRNFIDYIGLPSNYLETLKKYYLSSMYTYHGSDTKSEIFMSTFLIFYVMVLPKWNYIVDGWNNHHLFIPHITKIVTATIFGINILYTFLAKISESNQTSIFLYLLRYITIISIFFVVLNWNAVFTNWSDSHILYSPHITKMYVIILFSFLFINRGLFIPIKKKVNYKKIIPLKWLLIGFLGISLDIVKFLGTLSRLFLRLKSLMTF